MKRLLHCYKCKKLKRFVLLVSVLLEEGSNAPVFYCLFLEPSGMPVGVWARSVSASEIEVNWQALSFSPERVLGYEVHFTLLNGNRNHTQHNSNACHRPCRTWEPSLTAKIIQFFVTTWQEHISECFQENKRKSTCRPHAFSCCCQFWGSMLQSFMIVMLQHCTRPRVSIPHQKLWCVA